MQGGGAACRRRAQQADRSTCQQPSVAQEACSPGRVARGSRGCGRCRWRRRCRRCPLPLRRRRWRGRTGGVGHRSRPAGRSGLPSPHHRDNWRLRGSRNRWSRRSRSSSRSRRPSVVPAPPHERRDQQKQSGESAYGGAHRRPRARGAQGQGCGGPGRERRYDQPQILRFLLPWPMVRGLPGWELATRGGPSTGARAAFAGRRAARSPGVCSGGRPPDVRAGELPAAHGVTIGLMSANRLSPMPSTSLS